MTAGILYMLYIDEKLYKGVFEGTDYTSAFGLVRFRKSKMVDPIWPLENCATHI